MVTERNKNTAFRLNATMQDLRPMNIKRILLADDDDDDYNLFNAAILSINPEIEILRTDDGIMLSSIIETAFKPDIIVIDINMPFKNGIACLKEIKSKEEFNSIRVVIYSTSNFVRDVDLCYNYGADFYLVKAISFQAIIEQLEILFTNEYFVKGCRPPREKFVIDTKKPIAS